MLRWSFQNATIAGNKLTNNPAGIVLWDGCYRCTITNNTLVNSRGIILAGRGPVNVAFDPLLHLRTRDTPYSSDIDGQHDHK